MTRIPSSNGTAWSSCPRMYRHRGRLPRMTYVATQVSHQASRASSPCQRLRRCARAASTPTSSKRISVGRSRARMALTCA